VLKYARSNWVSAATENVLRSGFSRQKKRGLDPKDKEKKGKKARPNQ